MNTAPEYLDTEYLDLGADVERRQHTAWTPRDMEALEAQARHTVEREAKHLNYWLALWDEHDMPLDTLTLARELHKAYLGGTVRHCLRDVALDHVERAVAEELEELINAD